MTLDLLKWLQDAGVSLCLGMWGLTVLESVLPAGPQEEEYPAEPDGEDSPAARAARDPEVRRAAAKAGACQRRYELLNGRATARAMRRRRHHWRRYQRWVRVLQLRFHRRLRRWEPLEFAALMLLASAAIGFCLVMAMIVETGTR